MCSPPPRASSATIAKRDERLLVLELSMTDVREVLEGEPPTRLHPDPPPGLIETVRALGRVNGDA